MAAIEPPESMLKVAVSVGKVSIGSVAWVATLANASKTTQERRRFIAPKWRGATLWENSVFTDGS
jgi:hypothetical protein